MNARRAARVDNPGTMDKLPALFLSHGSPMTALEPGAAGAFLRALGPAIDRCFGRPRAVLAVSAHTLARRHVLLAGARHAAVHDFSGFPEALYQLRYDAPGAPALAPRVAELMQAAGLSVQTRDQGGLDHGIWAPLRHLYPEADIAVLPLAFSPQDSPDTLWALGRALAPLAGEGVLILASGSLTHNLRLLCGLPGRASVQAPEMPACAAFRAWVAERAAARDGPALRNYRNLAPHAALMHPSDEHWLPFYVAAGAGGESAVPQRLHASLTYGVLAMDSYAFGSGAEALAQEIRAAVAA